MALSFSAVFSMPARMGQWQQLRLADGTEVRAELCGDEFTHFWRTADGQILTANDDGTYRLTTTERLVKATAERRSTAMQARASRLARVQANNGQRRAGTFGGANSYLGKKKGLIILVNFTDVKFKTSDNQALYERIANEKNFSYGNFKGSMYDYFYAQSEGAFELTFDVVGPVTVSKSQSYYGSNSDGSDKYPATMVIEALKLVDADVNYADYDWDGDGEVDQVYVVYAGMGEADGGAASTIWPHEWQLSSANYYGDGSGSQKLDGVKIDTYACGAELNGSNVIAGIGTMCHEFSHCLGFPDFYDTDYSGGQGMANWDLMDVGSYNGNGYRPAGYTSYERWMAGWKTPIELTTTQSIDNMKSLQDGGESYIIYNEGNRDEYFLLENRQKTNWDAGLPGAGLLIVHVDYKASAWTGNTVNDDKSHQRMTWIPADNEYQTDYNGYLTPAGLANDPFPYSSSNAFSKTSTPAAKLYNKNSDGTYFLATAVENIKRNSDKSISFDFKGTAAEEEPGDEPGDEPDDEPTDKPLGKTLFVETFDKCNGTGGNDGKWDGNVATSTFYTDNAGWSATASYGGKQCAKFGSSRKSGAVTTPTITLTDEAVLTFNATPFGTDGTTLNVKVASGNASITPSSFTMKAGEWTTFTATLKGSGNITLTFTPAKRLFLDEVSVKAVAKTVKGDVNGDGAVTIADVTLLVNIILGKTEGNTAADVNGDGNTTIADVTTLVNIILGKE